MMATSQDAPKLEAVYWVAIVVGRTMLLVLRLQGKARYEWEAQSYGRTFRKTAPIFQAVYQAAVAVSRVILLVRHLQGKAKQCVRRECAPRCLSK